MCYIHLCVVWGHLAMVGSFNWTDPKTCRCTSTDFFDFFPKWAKKTSGSHEHILWSSWSHLSFSLAQAEWGLAKGDGRTVRSAWCLGRYVVVGAPTKPAAVAVPAMRPARESDGREVWKQWTSWAKAVLTSGEHHIMSFSSQVIEADRGRKMRST